MAEEKIIAKLGSLTKFKRLIKQPVTLQTPFSLTDQFRYRKYRVANILKKDFDRVQIIDFLLSNLYKVFLMLQERQWQEAFTTLYANITLIEMFNEFIVCIKHTFMLALILQKMDLPDKAI